MGITGESCVYHLGGQEQFPDDNSTLKASENLRIRSSCLRRSVSTRRRLKHNSCLIEHRDAEVTLSTMYCQECRTPLKLDGSLNELNPAAFMLLTDSQFMAPNESPSSTKTAARRRRSSFQPA